MDMNVLKKTIRDELTTVKEDYVRLEQVDEEEDFEFGVSSGWVEALEWVLKRMDVNRED